MNRFKIIGMSLMLSTLVACDNNRVDSATEAVNKQVDNVAQPKSLVQPYAKVVDKQLKAVHTTLSSSDDGQAPVAFNKTASDKHNE